MGFSHFLGTASLSNNVILGIKHVNWHKLYVLLVEAEIERLRLRLHTFKREFIKNSLIYVFLIRPAVVFI